MPRAFKTPGQLQAKFGCNPYTVEACCWVYIIWAPRSFEGALGTLKGTYRVYSRYKYPRLKGIRGAHDLIKGERTFEPRLGLGFTNARNDCLNHTKQIHLDDIKDRVA